MGLVVSTTSQMPHVTYRPSDKKPETALTDKTLIYGIFYMAFACCVNVYMVSVHTSST